MRQLYFRSLVCYERSRFCSCSCSEKWVAEFALAQNPAHFIECKERNKRTKYDDTAVDQVIHTDILECSVHISSMRKSFDLRRYINAYSANARPIQWKYSNPTRRIRSNEITATGQEGRVTIVLANPEEVKNRRGHKTDRKNAERLADLLRHNHVSSCRV